MRRVLPEAEMMLSFFVAGEPVPKGSFRAFNTGKGARITNSNPKTKDWELRIAMTAQERLLDWTPGYEGAVSVECDFRFARPKSASKNAVYKITRPDIDKIARAVLDGITGVVIRDDSQVVQMTAFKRYAEKDAPVGVYITVKAL